MTTTKTTPLAQIGPTRIDTEGPFVRIVYGEIPSRNHYQSFIKAHSLARITFYKYFTCLKCKFKTPYISDLRKNKGCHIFSRYDTVKFRHLHIPDLYESPNYKFICIGIREEPIRGCNIHDRSEWVWYPETGKAIGEDKVINERVQKEMKKYK